MIELTFEQRIALRMLSRALHMTDSSGAWELVLANTDALSSQTLALMTDAVADTLDPSQAIAVPKNISDVDEDDPDDFLHPECSVCRGRHPNDGRHPCE